MTAPSLGPCGIDGCTRAATRNTPWGLLCESHRRRLHPSRAGGTPLLAPIQEKRTLREKLREAAIAMADASSEDDDAHTHADEQLARAAKLFAGSPDADLIAEHEAAKARAHRRSTKAGLAKAKSQGKRLGRPRTLDYAAVAHLVTSTGSVRKAAELLGVTEQAVRYVLKARPKNPPIPSHGDMHSLGGFKRPPPEGGSDS